MKPLTSYTRVLDEGQAKALQVILKNQNYEFREAPHAVYGASSQDVNVVYYKSGKLVAQGKGVREFVEFVLEPMVLGVAELGYERELNPEQFESRIGVDESGKGDFFGPLCVAGVYIAGAAVETLQEAGVRDSKRITSDSQIQKLAKAIRQTEGCFPNSVVIGPEAYNRMHAKLGSVNSVLAWGHARVIENLLEMKEKFPEPPKRVVVDQFALSQRTVKDALLRLGREATLIQRHKAESDIAVAAASILARDEFVTRLKKMSREYGVELPKGASKLVEERGREFVGKHGREALGKVAKMHFRTSGRIIDNAA